MKLDSALTPFLGQVIRFGVVGGFVTLVGMAVYYFPATFMGVHPLAANLLAYLVAMGLGFVLHSNVSFKGHGSRDNPGRRTGRFFVVSLVSLGLNSLFVWVLTGLLDGPTWWPLIPMLLVTPVVTFSMNRHWVFG
ncbi:MAG TPA: GtrA family protein [Allosphingosinicella sp.]|nr:GtrA family protein [Allosphingosinicella sp.]